ncbi:protein disulfide-isomerase A5-like [Haliotis rubra]|uniref:protein disulfide-isomerase A5-like n=1 Tax=Haliotis rubra TaxID=36100 RepID=UPI001EE5860A|nr:protein disulfide-isomerase A5-like [Haliotis rubra]
MLITWKHNVASNMAKGHTVLLFLSIILSLIPTHLQAKQGKPSLILRVDDYKEYKKLLRTKTNLLVIFAQSEKAASKSMTLFEDVAEEVKGKGTMAFINCGEEKKLCKKLKSTPAAPYTLKHFKDGDYNRDYDRKLVFKSMVNFMLDPTGDLPWEEDSTAQDVVHIDKEDGFNKLLRKEKHPMLVMFYAPWCGYCKRLKPEFASAATELRGNYVLVGIDVDKPQQMALRAQYNITGFPTIYYFEKGRVKYKYGGENTKDGIISWMKDPKPPQEPKKEAEWSEEESDVVHLDDANFADHIAKDPSVLVMFYAPWCGHCKKMKPDYSEAAKEMKEGGISGTLAAVDATKSRKMAEEYKVQGFPTVKYFKDGQYAFDVNERTKEKIMEFMKDPKEPPPPPPPEPKWDEQESDVEHLGDDTFKAFLRKKKHALVMFYAPWCGHCKKAKPEFTAAASQFKDDSKVAYAAVDCTIHTGVCGTHDVSGYPTFKYFNYGKNSQKYMGGREEADFVHFMKDPLNPTPTPVAASQPPKEDAWKDVTGHENVHILSDSNFDGFIKEKKSVLVMFYAPWCGHCKAMKPAYGEAAAQLKKDGVEGVLAAVDATVDTAVAGKYEIRGYPTLKYFKDGALAFEYSSGRSSGDLVSFMKNPTAPPPPPPPEPEWSDEKNDVYHPTDKDFDSFMAKEKSVLVMFYAPWCGHCKKMKPAFAAAAARLKKESPNAKLVAVDATKYKDIGQRYGVAGYPTLKYFEHGQEKFDYSGGRTEDAIVQFLKNPKAPPPPPPPEPEWSTVASAVNHLTSDTFSDFMAQRESVLVMFYAPWCGHCKRAKPDFQSGSEAIKGDKKKAFAAVDCTKNTDVCKKEDVSGYPTIKLYVGGKFLTAYNGDRTKDEFVKFLKNAPTIKKDEL